MSTMLNFKYGLHAGLPATKSAGTIYVTTDEKAMYVDLPNKQDASKIDRIRLSQIITCSYDEWVNLKPPYSTEAFYYIIDKNALLKYNDGTAPEGSDESLVAGWVQINSTAALDDAIDTLNIKLYGTDGKSGDINSLKTNVANLRTDVDGLIGENGTIAGINGRLDALEDQDGVIDGQIKALDKKITDGLAAAGSNETVKQLQADMTSVKDALSDGADGLIDVSAVQEKANAALPTATFTEFQTANAQAIAAAKQEATDHADAEVKKLSDGQVATNKNDIVSIKAALSDGADGLLDVSDISDKVNKAILKDGSVAMAADLDIGGHKVINVVEPTANLDAANKAYVDAQVKTAADAAAAAQRKADTAAADAATGIANAAAAQTRADNAYTLAEGKATIADVEAKGYAVASEVAETYATKTALDGVSTVANRADAKSVENETAISNMLKDSTAKTFKELEEQIANAGTTAGNTYATKTELADAKTAILGEENYGQTVKSAYEKAAQGVADAAAALAEAQKKTTMADVEAKGYATKTEVANTYATKTEAQGYATDAAALVRGETTETVASVDAKAEKNKTDIAALDKEVDDLRDNLLSKIQTADAMTYEGTVASEAELLAKTGVNKGDTYKATAEFELDGAAVRIGDLLIAQGAEDAATGVIANPIWDHVPSGYHADYVPEFSLTDGGPDDTDKSVTLNLTSAHAGDDVGDLGKVTFSVAQDSAITLTSTDTAANVGTITIGLAWSTF